jgi:hypothetical protein
MFAPFGSGQRKSVAAFIAVGRFGRLGQTGSGANRVHPPNGCGCRGDFFFLSPGLGDSKKYLEKNLLSLSEVSDLGMTQERRSGVHASYGREPRSAVNNLRESIPRAANIAKNLWFLPEVIVGETA